MFLFNNCVYFNKCMNLYMFIFQKKALLASEEVLKGFGVNDNSILVSTIDYYL